MISVAYTSYRRKTAEEWHIDNKEFLLLQYMLIFNANFIAHFSLEKMVLNTCLEKRYQIGGGPFGYRSIGSKLRAKLFVNEQE